MYFFGGGGSGHGKLAKPAPQKALEQNPVIKDQSDATIVVQDNVTLDMACSEDAPILIPRSAAGSATSVGILVCYWSIRKTEG